ncbi:hypothetical protein HD806DRAFT_473952 [Xylariaceae sp. AK1471]|nr:hypothetical protein HD806DRAFT_473952 [Xylariaceae sp. AK1471]
MRPLTPLVTTTTSDTTQEKRRMVAITATTTTTMLPTATKRNNMEIDAARPSVKAPFLGLIRWQLRPKGLNLELEGRRMS